MDFPGFITLKCNNKSIKIYNRYNSYPSFLGCMIINDLDYLIEKYGIKELAQKVDSIITETGNPSNFTEFSLFDFVENPEPLESVSKRRNSKEKSSKSKEINYILDFDNQTISFTSLDFEDSIHFEETQKLYDRWIRN